MNAINKIATTMLMVFCMTGMWAQKGDWAQLGRYSDDNEKAKLLPQEQRRVVFFGNSITDIWAQVHPEFFKSNGYIGRGISGQTTYKYIVRVREDVINLKPKYVVIGGAINDIAENTRNVPEKVASLNARLKAYAKKNKIVYADYYPLLVHGEDRALNPQYTHDGVHPTEKGYEVMEKYIQGILKKLL